MIYFDNASTSFSKAPGLEEVCKDFLSSPFSPNRSSYEEAFKIEKRVFQTRKKLLDFFKAPKDFQVIFTPGLTFSINTFIKGFLKEGDHVLISPLEHNAVTRPLFKAKIDFSLLPSNEVGRVEIERAGTLLRKNTKAIILNHASNLSGLVQDIEEVGKFAKENGLIFALDTAQSAGHLFIDISGAGVDFLAFSCHKALIALPGSGGFIAKKSLLEKLSPILEGGTGSLSESFDMPSFSPDKFEAGTGNTLGILALSHSIDYINSLSLEKIRERERELFEYFVKRLGELKDFYLQGFDGGKYTPIVSLRHKSRDIAEIARDLDEKYSIASRVGVCCAPLACKTLKILEKGGVLRFSLSHFNTREEIDSCIRALEGFSS